MGLLTRISTALGLRAGEGEYREGPYTLPVSGGSLPAGTAWNFWQQGYDVQRPTGRSAIVQACVSAYAQTAAMCMGSHWRARPDGGRDRVTNSALSRILLRPNAYQSPSDFILNLTSLLYRHGNAYALAIRNSRYEIVELHLMQQGRPQVALTGEVFYDLSGNEVIERQLGAPASGVPSRDVLHVRLETPRHPLIGDTPLTAAALDLAASNAMMRQAITFYDRQSRPSGVLSTDALLNADQVRQIRDAWNEQASGLNAGGIPVLANGMKFYPMSSPAKDTQFAEIMKASDQNIALAYRVPLQVLGIGDNAMGTTEALMRSWLASGLGFALNHVEQAYDRLFGLTGAPTDYTELDTSILLRSDFKTRVEGWVAGVKGGLFARNEGRADFEFGRVDGGDEPWVQQQDIPLSVAARLANEPPAPALPPPPASSESDQDDERDFDAIARAYSADIYDAARTPRFP